MANEAIPRLRVDPELNLLVAPLAEDIRTDLENKMTAWGMSMPIRFKAKAAQRAGRNRRAGCKTFSAGSG